MSYRLFDYAKQAGIWIIIRSGPYINAETTAGGIALWCTAGGCGVPRTHDEAYHQAWLPFVTKVGQVFARNSVVEGGMAILNQHENEFIESYHDPNWTGVKYMVQIGGAFKNVGAVVPSTHNEKGMRSQSWSKDYLDVGGSVDIYGLDSYPNGFNCANPTGGFTTVKYATFTWSLEIGSEDRLTLGVVRIIRGFKHIPRLSHRIFRNTKEVHSILGEDIRMITVQP